MAFKPGKSGNPEGRPPGSKNKATVELREKISSLLDAEFDTLVTEFRKLDTDKKFDVFVKLLEYAIPKLSRVETREITSIEELLLMPREERLQRMAEIKRQLENEKP